VIYIKTETIKLGRIVINYWNKTDFKELMAETLTGRKAYTSRSISFDTYLWTEPQIVDR
jgi:hypothetical protein